MVNGIDPLRESLERLKAVLEKPVEPLHDATRWFLVVGIIACIIAAVPLIATLILAGWWMP